MTDPAPAPLLNRISRRVLRWFCFYLLGGAYCYGFKGGAWTPSEATVQAERYAVE